MIVTRYEKGIAYVRTWDAMTQRAKLATPRFIAKGDGTCRMKLFI